MSSPLVAGRATEAPAGSRLVRSLVAFWYWCVDVDHRFRRDAARMQAVRRAVSDGVVCSFLSFRTLT